MLLKVALLLGLARLGLALLPFKTLQRLFAQTSKQTARVPADPAGYRRRVVWAAEVAGKRLLGARPCLPQALVTQWLLNRAGCPATLRIGVAKGHAGQLLAHAWVEHDGKVVIGGAFSPARYKPLLPIKTGHSPSQGGQHHDAPLYTGTGTER
jgi:hypothetical protein